MTGRGRVEISSETGIGLTFNKINYSDKMKCMSAILTLSNCMIFGYVARTENHRSQTRFFGIHETQGENKYMQKSMFFKNPVLPS